MIDNGYGICFKYSSISVKSVAYCAAKSLGGVISAVSSLEHENKDKVVIDKIK
jgi:hypothetical protein